MNSRTITLGIAVIFLFFICFFTTRIFMYGLQASNHESKSITIAVLLLPILYIGSMLGSRTAKRIGKTPFIIVNVLAGIFFYLFLGAVVLGIVSIIFLATGHVIVPVSIGWAILTLSLLAALVGFIQAKRIVITRYTVTLPHAPASWNGKTAAMISDTHFGLINYTKFANKVVAKILSVKPDFVLHAGDFYDGPIVDTAPITAIWKKLTAEVPLFYTPGNHEAYGDYAVFVESVRAAGATVLDNKVTEYEGVQIAGTLYEGGKENPEIEKVLASLSLDAGKATILINHPPTAFEAPLKHGVNLIVSGHTHQGQFWPLRYVTHKVYGKYDYGMHPYKTLTSITSDGIGTYGPPLRLINSPEVVLITFKTA
jgi:predicted MPP superfamily phosphohydrolase